MKHVSEYNWGPSHIPWTIIGKGPSFQSLLDCSPPGYRMGINQVVRELKVNVAIFNDYENLLEMREYLGNCQHIFVPQHMHLNAKPMPVDTRELCSALIKDMSDRLYYYPMNQDGGVEAWHNTSEAAAELIASSGCKHIITAGLDGGHCFHPLFQKCNVIGPKCNYSKQHPHMQKVCDDNGAVLSKWGE